MSSPSSNSGGKSAPALQRLAVFAILRRPATSNEHAKLLKPGRVGQQLDQIASDQIRIVLIYIVFKALSDVTGLASQIEERCLD